MCLVGSSTNVSPVIFALFLISLTYDGVFIFFPLFEIIPEIDSSPIFLKKFSWLSFLHSFFEASVERSVPSVAFKPLDLNSNSNLVAFLACFIKYRILLSFFILSRSSKLLFFNFSAIFCGIGYLFFFGAVCRLEFCFCSRRKCELCCRKSGVAFCEIEDVFLISSFKTWGGSVKNWNRLTNVLARMLKFLQVQFTCVRVSWKYFEFQKK